MTVMDCHYGKPSVTYPGDAMEIEYKTVDARTSVTVFDEDASAEALAVFDRVSFECEDFKDPHKRAEFLADLRRHLEEVTEVVQWAQGVSIEEKGCA